MLVTLHQKLRQINKVPLNLLIKAKTMKSRIDDTKRIATKAISKNNVSDGNKKHEIGGSPYLEQYKRGEGLGEKTETCYLSNLKPELKAKLQNKNENLQHFFLFSQ